MLIGGIIRQIIVVSILSIIGLEFTVRLIDTDKQYLKFKDKLALDYLINLSADLDAEVGQYTEGFSDIINNKITPEDFEKHLFKSNRKFYAVGGWNCISYLCIDNKTNKIYVNTRDYYYGKDGLKEELNKASNIEAYIKRYAFTYYKADNRNTLSPACVLESNEDPYHAKFYRRSSERFTEYYWMDKRNFQNQENFYMLYNSMYRAWGEFIYITLWSCIFICIIIKLRKKGLKKIKLNLKNEVQLLKLKSLSWKYIVVKLLKLAIKIFNLVLERITVSNLKLRLTLILSLNTAIFMFSLKMSYLTLLKNYAVDAFIIYLILLFFYVMKKVNYFNYILKSTHKISTGDFSIKLKEKGDKDLVKLAHNINLIKGNYEQVLQERIKDEKLKSEIVLNVSNNLKLPVNSIKNYIKLYQNENALEVEKNEYIDIIYNKAKKLKSLIENLFEVSKLNSGKVELHKEKIDIVALIYQVIGETSFDYAEKNIKFIVDSFKEEIIINVDAKKISKLMENLISNALKYSVANTRVYIDVRQEQDKIKISIKNVADYELNADENKKVKLKNPGFGLVIANGIAELHGGSVKIEGEGDLFKVYLKLKYCEI